MVDREATLRQRLVFEIGDEGQARIAVASATVSDPGLSGDVEARYLSSAGFGALQLATEQQAVVARELAPDAQISVGGRGSLTPSRTHEAPAAAADALIEGAGRALRRLREVIASP